MITSSFYSKNNLFILKNEFIIILSIAQVFFSGIIYPFQFFQRVAEIILIILFSAGIINSRLLKWEIYLFAILILSIFFSFVNFDFIKFLSITKSNLLGILALIYFNKIRFKSRIILPVFFISLSLVVINELHNHYAEELINKLISFSSSPDFNSSRFGGVFLNAHFNAVFVAIPLIYYSHKRLIYNFFGIYFLKIMASKFAFVAYLFHIIECQFSRYFRKVNVLYWEIFLLLLPIIFLIFFKRNFLHCIDFFNGYTNNGKALDSLYIIYFQLLHPDYLKIFFNIFPGVFNHDFPLISVNGILHDGAVEIGFLSLVLQTGTLLGLYYIYFLIKIARSFLPFILITLLHINFVMTPIIIYLLIMYSHEIQLIHGASKSPDLKIKKYHNSINKRA